MSELVERVIWRLAAPSDGLRETAELVIGEVLAAILTCADTTPLIHERIEQGSLADGLELFAILEDLAWPPDGTASKLAEPQERETGSASPNPVEGRSLEAL